MQFPVDFLRRRGVLAVLGLALLATPVRAQDVAASALARVRFASIEEGRALLGADDAWIAATSDFQRAATAGVRPPMSRRAFQAYLASRVRSWPAAAVRRWQAAVAAVMARASALGVPLPPELLIINTDGRDAANAPYTRGHAIVLPTAALLAGNRQMSDPFLIAHELFHVVSRHNPGLADRLYAIIGFEPVEPLQWPVSWLPARIANPDAPLDRHAMRLAIDGRDTLVMPLLVARRTELGPGESFFDVMDVRLLEVTAAFGQPTLPVLRNGEPVWHSPERLAAYVARLGGNTGYIIHPDETLADNFAQLLTGQPVNNPALLREIEAVLQAPLR
ncbi:MAG: hypothetical protein ABIQ06_00820 [Caldimonas sp.]